MSLTTSYMLQCFTEESFLVEKTEAHVIVVLLFFLLDLGGSGGGSGSCSGRGSSCELAGISQELLEHLSLLEGDLGDGSDGQEVLHAVGDAVRSRGHGGVTDGETHGGDIGDSGHELVLDVVI